MPGIFSKYIFNNAIFNTGVDSAMGGGKKSTATSFHTSRHEWEVSEYARLKADKERAKRDLEAKEQEIKTLETKRLEALADEGMQLELIALFEQAQLLEQERLIIAERWLRFMQQEEEIFLLMCAMSY